MEESATTDTMQRLIRSRRLGGGKLGPLTWALAIQLGLLLLTVVVVVVAPSLDEDPAFVAKKTIYLPQRELEHQAAVAEFQAAASAPVMPERLTTESLLPDAMPDLPALPSDTFTPFESDSPAPNAEGLLSGSGLMGALSGLSAGSSEVNFFGIRENATRIVILVDTSNSMFERTRSGKQYRFDFTKIKDEAAGLISSLNANTLFNVAIYEGGSMAWSNFLVPATVENKASATSWIRSLSENPRASIGSRGGPGTKLMEGGGTRLDTGFKQVFSFQPEVIFVVTDGEINRSSGGKIGEDEILGIIRGFQDQLESPARIHMIQYETAVARDEEISAMRAIASRNKGRYRKIKADQL
ncbi:VWA domain-containing protein [Rubellicoccus peritrichatus]|uniref:VWA domain-containing protein n=1 Tax=Rubellicoccus peritrichatus TaxID=3080537 RepID=A0AAQ3LJ94_9BACT|nr:VWA domain-containing protein [Puniceicoccus sp. CR14]WOO43204.1 VWA domain-containing protein [Puniceicoccus sp. CR14]